MKLLIKNFNNLRSPSPQVPLFLSLWQPQVFTAALTPRQLLPKLRYLQKYVWVLREFFRNPAKSKQQDHFETQLNWKPLTYRAKSCTKGPSNTNFTYSYPYYKTEVFLSQLSETSKKNYQKLKKRCLKKTYTKVKGTMLLNYVLT